jgi:Mn-dependent DtxR family transcriptional regulator
MTDATKTALRICMQLDPIFRVRDLARYLNVRRQSQAAAVLADLKTAGLVSCSGDPDYRYEVTEKGRAVLQ